MELLFNDLSVHGQFPNDLTGFRDAIGRVMVIRETARRFGRELYCHRNTANAQVTHALNIPQSLKVLKIDQRRGLMQWLTRQGPFWEVVRQHSGDDWLDYNGDIVTDTAVGEAAHCVFYGVDRALVSMKPSSWLTSPLSVTLQDCQLDSAHVQNVNIDNYWDVDKLKAALVAAPSSLGSWRDLETTARIRFPNLTFSSDSFEKLEGHPFAKGAAERLLGCLAVLHDLKGCFGENGERTPDGHRLYDKHFAGDKAWFSDSSDTEKSRFEKDLTFAHPTKGGESLFCPWHGKVKTPQLRIHFSWPVRANKPLYVVYVGPKITIK